MVTPLLSVMVGAVDMGGLPLLSVMVGAVDMGGLP